MTRRQFLSAAAAAALAGLPGRAQAAGPVRLGAILSVTGPAAFLGEDMRDGPALAVNEINNQGGILGQPMEPIRYSCRLPANPAS